MYIYRPEIWIFVVWGNFGIWVEVLGVRKGVGVRSTVYDPKKILKLDGSEVFIIQLFLFLSKMFSELMESLCLLSTKSLFTTSKCRKV